MVTKCEETKAIKKDIYIFKMLKFNINFFFEKFSDKFLRRNIKIVSSLETSNYFLSLFLFLYTDIPLCYLFRLVTLYQHEITAISFQLFL